MLSAQENLANYTLRILAEFAKATLSCVLRTSVHVKQPDSERKNLTVFSAHLLVRQI